MDIANIALLDSNTTPVDDNSSRVSNAGASALSSDPADSLANKEAFLQLLIAQIKNQDPLNPTDGIEFLSQLAQFSELEQLIGMRNDIQALGEVAASQGDQPEAGVE